MKLAEAINRFPDLPVLSQLEQLQAFTDAGNGTVILPKAIIAVDMTNRRYHIATGSVICDDRIVGECEFDAGCEFGAGGIFGADCRFGAGCKFGDECYFGAGCRFGVHCRFGDHCVFGDLSFFGAHCAFDTNCRFGDDCRFGAGCVFGDFAGTLLYDVNNIGSRNGTTYFFMNNNGIYVLCGCYNGLIDDFAARVERVHKKSKLYLSQYRTAIKNANNYFKRGEK